MIMAIVALFDAFGLCITSLVGVGIDANCEYVQYVIENKNVYSLKNATDEDLAEYSDCQVIFNIFYLYRKNALCHPSVCPSICPFVWLSVVRGIICG